MRPHLEAARGRRAASRRRALERDAGGARPDGHRNIVTYRRKTFGMKLTRTATTHDMQTKAKGKATTRSKSVCRTKLLQKGMTGVLDGSAVGLAFLTHARRHVGAMEAPAKA